MKILIASILCPFRVYATSNHAAFQRDVNDNSVTLPLYKRSMTRMADLTSYRRVPVWILALAIAAGLLLAGLFGDRLDGQWSTWHGLTVRLACVAAVFALSMVAVLTSRLPGRRGGHE
jgi:hypothetical protein